MRRAVAFREANPRVTFVLKDVITKRVLSLVRSEEVDLGVLGGDLADPDIEIVCAAQDRMHVVFPAEHPIGAYPAELREGTVRVTLPADERATAKNNSASIEHRKR